MIRDVAYLEGGKQLTACTLNPTSVVGVLYLQRATYWGGEMWIVLSLIGLVVKASTLRADPYIVWFLLARGGDGSGRGGGGGVGGFFLGWVIDI